VRSSLAKRLWPLVAVPLLLGWHHILSPEAYFSANHSVRAATVLAEPEAWRGTTLILGGKILETRQEDGGGMLAILCYGLNENGKPTEPDVACGRFLAKSTGTLDPQRFEAGRLVTLTGTLTQNRGAVPIFDIGEIRLWPEKKDRDDFPRPYYYPFYDPFCDPFYSPYHWRSRWCW